jgi:hypothetical protein
MPGFCSKRWQTNAVGEKGRVTGMVAGQQVVFRGTVSASSAGRRLPSKAPSLVKGDIHHLSFAIEPAAQFERRSRQDKGEPDHLAVVKQRPLAQPEAIENKTHRRKCRQLTHPVWVEGASAIPSMVARPIRRSCPQPSLAATR